MVGMIYVFIFFDSLEVVFFIVFFVFCFFLGWYVGFGFVWVVFEFFFIVGIDSYIFVSFFGGMGEVFLGRFGWNMGGFGSGMFLIGMMEFVV